MNCYFDTSIYNKIFDDIKKDLIIKEMNRREMIIIPSIINKCEILLTSDSNRKKNLLNLYDIIRNDYFPLKAPPDLLRESVLAIQQKKDEMEVNYPIKSNDEIEGICKELKNIAGIEIEKALVGAREYIKRNLDKIKITEPISYFAYIDSEKGIQIQVMLVKNLCASLNVDLKLNEEGIISLIKSYDTPWKYFLDSYLYFCFTRGVRLEDYGKDKSPGHFDLDQCIYLYWANIFVMQDGEFYDFLKELNESRGYNKKIFTYDEFKKDLGL